MHLTFNSYNLVNFNIFTSIRVILSITVENTVKNITSDACLKQLTTGDPCEFDFLYFWLLKRIFKLNFLRLGSTYDELYEIDKKTAPYPDAIEIYIPTEIFTSTGYINDIKLLVSTSTGCCKFYSVVLLSII